MMVRLALLVLVGAAVAEAVAMEPPAQAPRDKLTLRGQEVYEGRRVLVDEDTYPREPAKLVEGPAVRRNGDKVEIVFALDKPDDVLLRIVDADGNTVRNLACGLLGENAPPPFQKGALRQKIVWDGKDNAGKSAPSGCKARVAVGLRPRLDRFVAHDPAQLVSYVCGIEVDKEGRVYVTLFTDRRGEPQVMRFDREGSYLETVYPPNPNLLEGKLEDVYRWCDYVDGRAVPMRFGGAWPFIIYKYHTGNERDPTRYPFPLRIAPDGGAYIAETQIAQYHSQMTPSEYKAVGPVGARLFSVKLDPFWFLQGMTMGVGPWAIDGQGFAYLCRKQTIVKVTLDGLQPVCDFEYDGPEKLEDNKKQSTLGTLKQRADSPPLFQKIQDLAVDGQGNLYVVDATQLKTFRSNGQPVGTLQEYELDGKRAPLGAVHGVRTVEAALYVVSRLAPAKGRTASTGQLVKFRLAPDTEPKALWAVPLDGLASLIAVDAAARPPIVWVAGGGGAGTFSRIVDRGGRPGDIRHCGSGIRKGVLMDPWAIALDDRGRIFVFDYARGAIVRTNDDGSQWMESKRPGTKSLYIDRVRGRLFASQSARLHCLDLDLDEQEDFELSGQKAVARGGMNLGAVDAAGNLYVSDLKKGVPQRNTKPDHYGVVRQYGPHGELKKRDYCETFLADGGLAIDSQGCLYIADTCRMGFMDAVHNWSVMRGPKWKRGQKVIRAQSDLAYLVKFPPGGGCRGKDTELWAHRGVSPVMGGGCKCPVATNCVTVDEADRVFATDYTMYHVKVLDTSGNLITRIGAWGNADCRGPGSKYPKPEIAFGWVHSIDAFGDSLYASDKDLRRVVKVRMDYRQTKEAQTP